MAYEADPDALDDICKWVRQQPTTYTDIEKLYARHDEKHKFYGMIESIDCTGWSWENCPVALRAQFCRETAHGRIEDRIRQLEAVTARARARQRWRHTRNNQENSYMGGNSNEDGNANAVVDVEDGTLSYMDSSAKECLVCKGEVFDSSITPIYENGKNQLVLKLESGVKIPPRPRARRVESIRQQRVVRGISHIPVSEALRRIRIRIGSIRKPLFFRDLEETYEVIFMFLKKWKTVVIDVGSKLLKAGFAIPNQAPSLRVSDYSNSNEDHE
nr:zinc finger, RING/FYVE/PHD-type [Tanacetum cinerariifolium]